MHETDCACGHEPSRGACPRLTYISLAVGEMALRETGERGLAANSGRRNTYGDWLQRSYTMLHCNISLQRPSRRESNCSVKHCCGLCNIFPNNMPLFVY
jgi:hypothetical protein